MTYEVLARMTMASYCSTVAHSMQVSGDPHERGSANVISVRIASNEGALSVELLQPLLRSLETGSVYALAALGIVLVWRTSLVMHFAQGSMGMFSGTAVAFVLNRTGSPLWLSV